MVNRRAFRVAIPSYWTVRRSFVECPRVVEERYFFDMGFTIDQYSTLAMCSMMGHPSM
jgi:hypothetical protein